MRAGDRTRTEASPSSPSNFAAAAIRCTSAGSSTAQVMTSRTLRRPASGSAPIGPRGLWRTAIQTIAKAINEAIPTPRPGPASANPTTIGTTIAAAIRGSFHGAIAPILSEAR